ncbi:S8 family serine peptidase [Candidatus Woesearchaeota archaeon]|nr:S8 family serine peptidase [Candidatus Woesearchaeota archaeon]
MAVIKKLLVILIIGLLLATGIDAGTLSRVSKSSSLNREKVDPLIHDISEDQTVDIIIDTSDMQSIQKRFSQQLLAPKTINNRFLAAKVRGKDLASLSRDKLVKKIHANREYAMLLEDAIPVTNAPDVWEMGYTGKNAKIAILDTGINKNHPMLKNKVINEKALVTDNPIDLNGHGTHVAGIAAGKKTSEGFNGVAPDALLINAKVLDNTGKGTTESIASGIYWAVDPDNNPSTNDGADIISMSLGAPYTTPDEVINTAIDEAISKGIVVVIASGNCGPGGSSSCKGFVGVTVPGSYEPAVTVGAVDNNLQWQTFSSGQNFGDYIKPDIVAPGASITSSVVNGYATKSGTSMATPFVAGAAALLLEKDNTLNQQKLKAIFENNALDLGDEGKDTKYGYGFMDVEKIIGVQIPEDIPKQESLMIINQNIGNNQFIMYNSFNETTIAYYGELAEYQYGENYKLKAGVLKFDDEIMQQSFLDTQIRYSSSKNIKGNEIFYNEDYTFWFWRSGLYFVWIITDKNITEEKEELFAAYFAKYPLTQQTFKVFTGTGVEQGTGDIDVEPLCSETASCDKGGYSHLNTGCTDSCDSKAYKTDLSSGVCHNKANYLSKGTTYSYEIDSKYTDKCLDATNVREYFLKCDDKLQFCSGQGFYCYADIIYQYDKNCKDYGTDYVCTDGACIKQVTCDYNPTCSYSTKRVCYSTTEYDKYTAVTDCSGGCKDTYVDNFACNTGKYCSGTTYGSDFPCYSCSTAKDKSCQSKNCYGSDPDCDANGNVYECLSNADCSANQYCSSNKCVACTIHSTKKCSNDDLYWYNSCGVKEEKYDDCQDPASICTSDNGGGEYYSGFCSTADNTCYYASFKACNDCANNQCTNSCQLSSASWSAATAVEGTSVTLTVNGDADCNGKTASFNVWEWDCSDYDYSSADCMDDPVTTNPSSSIFSSGTATTTWTAEWQDDGLAIDLPEYYFMTYVDGTKIKSATPDLEVSPAPKVCTLTNAYWSSTKVQEGTSVILTVESANCDGKSASFTIKEYDPGSPDDAVNNNPSSATFSNNKASTTWIAEWQDDEYGDPEYYFTASADGKTITSSDPKLEVTPTPCSLSTASWSTSSTVEGSQVTLTLTGNNCDGKSATFTVKEDDLWPAPDVPAQKQPSPAIFFNGKASTTWIAEWVEDISSDPEYYFTGTVESVSLDSGSLSVAKAPVCIDNDNDGYGTANTNLCQYSALDCNDNNANIHPNANEVCGNSIDDNCNNQIDEGCVTVTCGDGVCDSSETSSCSKDCYVKHKLTIQNVNPSSAKENQTVTIDVKVESIGTIKDARYIEAAVVPASWSGIGYPAADFEEEEVIPNPNPVCPGNTYYDSKIVDAASGPEIVTFTVKAPNKQSVDACNGLGSAWDTNFKVIAGTYVQQSGGSYEDFTSTSYSVSEGSVCPNGLDGSANCKCTTNAECSAGQECNAQGACVGIAPKACTIPDGSSSTCDCDSNKDCTLFGSYQCNFGPGYDACIGFNPEDECAKIDTYTCVANGVYRCEQIGSIKQLVLVDLCTVNELCPNDVEVVKQCKSKIGYDLVIDHASSGTVVNKQIGDSVIVKVKADQQFNLPFMYSSSIFDVASGSCTAGNYNQGETICMFTVKEDAALGMYSFTVGEDTETVRIIDNPYALYITDADQLYKRFTGSAKTGVDVLLAKTYEKAGRNRGLVYDLGKEITVQHPFDYVFGNYDEELESTESRNNDYVVEASNFIHDKCNGCKEVIVIGDDYVVPHYEKMIYEFQSPISFIGERTKQNFYTDIAYTTRETLLFSDFDEVFKIKGKYDGKNVLFVMPENPSDLLKAEIETLKQVLINKGYNPDLIEPINGNDVNCIDKKWFKDEASVQGTTLFIIGTEANNNALSCYPFITSEDTQDTAFIERNLWDNDEYAVIINTNDELVLKAFTEIIKTNEYLDLKSELAYFFKVSTEVASYTAMGATVVVIIVGTGGAAAPGVLLTAGAILDTIADSSDVTDTCIINPEGMGMCGFSVALGVIPLVPGKPVKNFVKKFGDTVVAKTVGQQLDPFKTIIKNNFKRLKIEYFGPKTWAKLIVKNNDNVYMARGVKRLFGENVDDLDVISKTIKTDSGLSPNIRRLQEGFVIKGVGKADQLVEDLPLGNKKDEAVEALKQLLKNSQDKNVGNRIGAQFELQTFHFENLDELDSFGKKVKNSEFGLEPSNGDYLELDKLRKDGTIIEEKTGSWGNIKDGTPKQIEKYINYQTKYGGNKIVYRIKSGDIASSSFIEAKKVLSSYSTQKTIQLEVINSEGNMILQEVLK